ncbi:AzlC family ABC transporter permease [Paralcaligenes sp. KSB-10]|uniref:AzlC family ABC transporter permease n=1 Tax=Paralcaligenes sp. KSB-10 TaxID=2901142 RepID=UPI00351CBBF9
MSAPSKSSASWSSAHARQSFYTGFYEVLPTLVATSMWAFVTGIALVKSGLTETMATLMTVLVYAGSAQLTALPLIVSGAPLWLVFAAGFVVNIRFVIFGAAMHPYFRRYSWQKRLALGYLSGDIVFVLFMSRYAEAREKGTQDQLWYFLGVIVPGWISWQLCSLIGIYLGALVPASWSLDFAAILALMAIIIPLVNTRPMVISVCVAGLVAWLGQPLPLRLGLVAAVAAGVLAGVAVERFSKKRRPR